MIAIPPTATLSTTPPRAASRARSRRLEAPRGSGFLLLVALAVVGCSGDGGEGLPPDGPVGAVVIVLDTVRADHVSCYGYERPTTPSIDALAEIGVRFEEVVAPAPWTLPSVIGLLAGEYPSTAMTPDGKLERSLIERFEEHGIRTAAITEGGYVSRHFGLDLGFGHFREEEGAVRLLEDGNRPRDQAPGGIEHTFAQAKQWLRDHGGEPFLLFVHTYEPHTPYTRHAFTEGLDPGRIGPIFDIDYLEQLRDGTLRLTEAERRYGVALYDGDIRESDRHVGELLAVLEETGLGDRTVVVVTSDHGEELGEHFERHVFDHGHSLRDDLLLVPLALHDPTREFAARVVPDQVRLIDVLPTVAELLSVPIDEDIPGTSLVPLMTGEERGDRVAISALTKRGPARLSMRDGRYKFILQQGPGKHPIAPTPPVAQLYDLDVDGGERTNRVQQRPKLARAMAESLGEWIGGAARGDPARIDVDDQALRERLRSLGYIE